jgi:hypothetical protein
MKVTLMAYISLLADVGCEEFASVVKILDAQLLSLSPEGQPPAPPVIAKPCSNRGRTSSDIHRAAAALIGELLKSAMPGIGRLELTAREQTAVVASRSRHFCGAFQTRKCHLCENITARGHQTTSMNMQAIPRFASSGVSVDPTAR